MPKLPEPLVFLDRFFTGNVTQRCPLNTPFSFIGLQVIRRHDALFGGQNFELSNSQTLVRRGGFPRYCSQGFSATEFPLAYYSARINNAVVNLVDTNVAVYTFTATTLTKIFTKSGGAGQTFFLQVGNKLYFANGVDNKKWDGTTVSNWGIAAPVNAPTFSAIACNFWRPLMPAPQYTSILDINGNVESQTNSASTLTAGTTYPSFVLYPLNLTQDGSIAWSNFGPISTWQSSTAYLNGVGGSFVIIDSNNNLQRVSGGTTGISGTTQPVWNASLGGTTNDNTLIWQNLGPGKQSVFSGYSYVYAYHTIYGHVSTASPPSINTGPVLANYNVTVSGAFSTDPQCDFVWVYRTKDGGNTYNFLAQVANNVAGGTWNFADTTPDASLNTQPAFLAPVAHANDPPPAGMTILAFHMQRPWGAAGNLQFFGAGPDTTAGVKEECWPPANNFQYPSNLTGMAPTSQGMLTFLKDQPWVVLGGPQTLSFYPQQVLAYLGISSPNCLCQDGDLVYIYTTSKQLFSLTFNGKSEDGFAVGDLLAGTFNPATSYLTLHRNGPDVGLFMSDGSGNFIPYNLNLNAWGTLCPVQGGIGAIASIETGFGQYTLMAGRPAGSGFILGRSLATFLDDGNPYAGNAIIGSLMVSAPGQPGALIESFVLQYSAAGSFLKVGVLANEIAGTFVDVPLTADEPWDISGTQYAPQSLRMKRYDWAGIQQQLPDSVRHLQVQVSMQAENAKSELFSLAICPPMAA